MARYARQHLQEQWGHLGDLPNWLLVDPDWSGWASEVHKDYREAKAVHFSALAKPSLDDHQRARNLLLTLWDWDPYHYRTSWLKQVCNGLNKKDMQEIFASSRLSNIYQCLDCEVSIQALSREQPFRKTTALTELVMADHISPTETVCELLCPGCTESRLLERLHRIKELREMNYRGFLRSSEWLAISALKYWSSGWRCAVC